MTKIDEDDRLLKAYRRIHNLELAIVNFRERRGLHEGDHDSVSLGCSRCELAYIEAERKLDLELHQESIQPASRDCKYCAEGTPEWSEAAQCWIHRRPSVDKRCTQKHVAPRESSPLYSKFAQDKPNPEGTQLYGISCNEGWSESIVCTGMYEWAADWLLGVIGREPYAKSRELGIEGNGVL